MLVRFAVSNFLSFKEETEFNLLTGNPRRFEHHVYRPVEGLELLKLGAIYGPNGAGKSNLGKAILFFRELIQKDWFSPSFFKFKLDPAYTKLPTTFELEFVFEGNVLLYGVDLEDSYIKEEWLYRSGVTKPDQLLFHRYTDRGQTRIELAEEFLRTPEDKLRVKLYQEELLKDTVPFLRAISEAKSGFEALRSIYTWFVHQWILIFPQSKARGLVRELVLRPDFYTFAQNLMCSFKTGIERLEIKTDELERYFGIDDQQEALKIKQQLEIARQAGDPLIFQDDVTKEDFLVVYDDTKGQPVVKRIVTVHKNSNQEPTEFELHRESDGTKRLLDLLPALYLAIHTPAFVFIDEVEQSIHPLLIKELIAKFAQDPTTKGQLVFTTHEAHLLDQDYMRQDEFWLAEKNAHGATTYVPLSDYNIRFDLDLRKGYLNGRFGATPDTNDLHDLNWSQAAQEKPQPSV